VLQPSVLSSSRTGKMEPKTEYIAAKSDYFEGLEPLEVVNMMQALASPFKKKLMPYIFQEDEVLKYLENDSFFFALKPSDEYFKRIAGYLHICEANNPVDINFMLDVRLIPSWCVEIFRNFENYVFMTHAICPSRGSFGFLIESLKERYDGIMCFTSINSPGLPGQKRHGIKFNEATFTMYNPYKGADSTFVWGVWKKDA